MRFELVFVWIFLGQPFGGYSGITVKSTALEGGPQGFAISVSDGAANLFTEVAAPEPDDVAAVLTGLPPHQATERRLICPLRQRC
ncbi:MAG: hypothetical protein ABGZ35_24860 [Planctomycetaceae bacterium]